MSSWDKVAPGGGSEQTAARLAVTFSALCDSAYEGGGGGLAPSGHSAGRLTQWRGKALGATRLKGSEALRLYYVRPKGSKALSCTGPHQAENAPAGSRPRPEIFPPAGRKHFNHHQTTSA